MSAWGCGIRQDDFVCDIVDAFKDCLKDGMSPPDASKAIYEAFADAIDDVDDGPLFWIALADMQWSYGDLDPLVFERVSEVINSGIDLKRWGDPSSNDYKKRKAVLLEFLDKISNPNTKPARPPKRISRSAKFKPGDCLSITLENGQFGAGIVLAIDESNREYPSDLVAVLDYLAYEPPSKSDFVKRNWLVLNHHSWRNKKDVCWYVSTGFKKMKPRLEVITNIPILPSDPASSRSYGGWNFLGQQILLQRQWDSDQGKHKSQ